MPFSQFFDCCSFFYKTFHHTVIRNVITNPWGLRLVLVQFYGHMGNPLWCFLWKGRYKYDLIYNIGTESNFNCGHIPCKHLLCSKLYCFLSVYIVIMIMAACFCLTLFFSNSFSQGLKRNQKFVELKECQSNLFVFFVSDCVQHCATFLFFLHGKCCLMWDRTSASVCCHWQTLRKGGKNNPAITSINDNMLAGKTVGQLRAFVKWEKAEECNILGQTLGSLS